MGFKTLWGKWIDGISDVDFIRNIFVDTAGTVYVCGHTTKELPAEYVAILGSKPIDNATSGGFVMKMSSSGVLQWGRWIDSVAHDGVYDIKADTMGNMYVVGSTTDSFQSDLGTLMGPKPSATYAAFIIKFNSSGVAQWGKWIDGTGSGVDGQGVTIDTAGNVYITGSSASVVHADWLSLLGSKPDGTSTAGAFIVKYNSSGVAQWGKWIDGSGSNDYSYGIASDSNNNVYITGYAGNNFQSELSTLMGAKPGATTGASYILKYNSSGVPQWGKWIDGSASSEQGNRIVTDSLNNIYVVGYGNGTFQTELASVMNIKPVTGVNNGAFVLKFNSSGVAQWGRWIDGASDDRGYGVAVDSLQNVYVTGYTVGDLQTDITSLIGTKPGASNNSFIVKYDNTGNLLGGTWIGGDGSDVTMGIGVDSNNNVYVGGYATYNLIAPIIDTKPVTTWNYGSFIIKYAQTTVPDSPTGVSATAGDASATIYFTTPAYDGGEPITEYRVLSGGSQVATGTSSPIVVSGLTNGQSYTFTVVAVNINGPSSPSDATSAVTPVAPATAPSGVPSFSTVTPSQTTIYVSFSYPPNSDGGSAIIGFDYAISSIGGSAGVATRVVGGDTATDFTISGLTASTGYTIYLRAVNAVGDGSWATIDSTTTASVGPWLTRIVSLMQSSTPITYERDFPYWITQWWGSDEEFYVTGELAASSGINVPPINTNGGPVTIVFQVSRNDGTVVGAGLAVKLLLNIVFSSSTAIVSVNGTVAQSESGGDGPMGVITGTTDSQGQVSFTINYVGAAPNASRVFSQIRCGLASNIDDDILNYDTIINLGYNDNGPAPGPAPSPSGGITSASHTPVTVNFNIAIEGDSNITIFGEQAPQVTNVIDAEVDLPVNALYDGRDSANMKGLIELWEPVDRADDIYAQLANTDSTANGGENLTGAYKVTLRQFAKGLQRILCGAFDCINATPFNESKYASSIEYTTQRDFGRVALGCFAHFMFGHVDATSAISNDTQFVKSMLSITSDAAAISEDPIQGPVARYAAYNSAIVTEIAGEFTAWTNKDGSALDANLARRLVAAVVNKGLDAQGNLVVSSVTNDGTDSIANIVKQVVGQDATRLMNEDNSERRKNVHRLLRFYPGDVIYMNILLNKPQVTVGPGQTVAGQNIADNYSSIQNYTLKITLKSEEDL